MSQKGKIYDDEQEWKRQAETVMSLAGKVIEASEGSIQERDGYKLVAKVFLHSANDDFKAVFLLVNSGLFSESAMVLRRLFELIINLRCIGQCPEKRAEQYLKFDPIERKKYIDIWSEYEPDALSEENQEWINTMYEEVMIDLGLEEPPPLTKWSGGTLKDRVREVGGIWPKQHAFVYKMCCLYTHVSPLGLSNCHETMPDGKLRYAQPQAVGLVVSRIAVQYFLSIIDKADEVLDTGCRDEIDKFWKSIMEQIKRN